MNEDGNKATQRSLIKTDNIGLSMLSVLEIQWDGFLIEIMQTNMVLMDVCVPQKSLYCPRTCSRLHPVVYCHNIHLLIPFSKLYPFAFYQNSFFGKENYDKTRFCYEGIHNIGNSIQNITVVQWFVLSSCKRRVMSSTPNQCICPQTIVYAIYFAYRYFHDFGLGGGNCDGLILLFWRCFHYNIQPYIEVESFVRTDS